MKPRNYTPESREISDYVLKFGLDNRQDYLVVTLVKPGEQTDCAFVTQLGMETPGSVYFTRTSIKAVDLTLGRFFSNGIPENFVECSDHPSYILPAHLRTILGETLVSQRVVEMVGYVTAADSIN
ncbi:MAG: hypothetical protein AABX51_00650 [Nanoarchaeota archaeon]|mgnify:CR=1 FL=1